MLKPICYNKKWTQGPCLRIISKGPIPRSWRKKAVIPGRRMAAFALLSCVFVLGQLADARAVGPGEPAFQKAMKKEFGHTRGNYIDGGGSVEGQFSQVLWPGYPNQTLADGNVLVSGCRPHDCWEKGAVVVTPAGAIVAAGLINFPCALKRKVEGVHCDVRSDPSVLTVFVRRQNNRPAIVQDVK